MKRYDYIIIGAGAAGLMLAKAMAKDTFFAQSSILILDKDTKSNNDRTWCFWEKDEGHFDDIVFKRWDQIYFGGKEYAETLSIKPYGYKMIRGVDFYKSMLATITEAPNIDFVVEAVSKVSDRNGEILITTNNEVYIGNKVFNSIFDYGPAKLQQKFPVLQQHFVGWFVQTQRPIFTKEVATFMDFSIPQKGNTRFMYVLPFSETEALVEYTLFSENLLPKEAYENAIASYLKENLHCTSYEILGKEQGNIPMTCYNFSVGDTKNMLHIGAAGGWGKPSTGYTFRNTHKKTQKLVQHLKNQKSLNSFAKRNRFWYYDLLLLDILHMDNSMGQSIFESLFKKRKPQYIFEFLDEESHFFRDLSVIFAAPKMAFIKALLKRIF